MKISEIKANFDKMSTTQKVATVAGAAAGVAAIGLTTAAAIRGGKINKVASYTLENDKFVKNTTEAATDVKFTDKLRAMKDTLVAGFKSIFCKEQRTAYKEGNIAETAKKISEQLKADKVAARAAEAAPKAEAAAQADVAAQA